ncbi:hypothetical protein TNCV_4629541 [Trichonephila clavipes]|nr:hypothetical protein TNCV_4629541 [Trichonephila clavipes]
MDHVILSHGQSAISRRKVYGFFVYGEPTVTGSAYLDALQQWLFPELKESEPELHFAARWCTTSLASLYSTNGFSAKDLTIKLASNDLHVLPI